MMELITNFLTLKADIDFVMDTITKKFPDNKTKNEFLMDKMFEIMKKDKIITSDVTTENFKDRQAFVDFIIGRLQELNKNEPTKRWMDRGNKNPNHTARLQNS